MSDYVSEGGHWYDGDGLPAYTQEIKTGKNKGKERPTTLRDARQLKLSPSVTTVLSILDKPALTHWKVMHALKKARWEILEWIPNPLLKRSFKDKFKVEEPDTEDKAKRGSEIHAAIERWLEGGGIEEGYEPYVKIVQGVMDELGIDITDVRSERSFTCKKYGYGGAVDFSVQSTKGDIIIDFKTKDMDEKKAAKKLAYDEHLMQLSAYRMGLEMPNAKLYNLFLSRDNPTVYQLHEWSEEDAEWGDNTFLSVLSAWVLLKRYAV